MAVAGGVTVKSPHNVGYPYEEDNILSPDGHCRTFDAKAQGNDFWEWFRRCRTKNV